MTSQDQVLLANKDQEQVREEVVLRVLDQFGRDPQLLEQSLFDTLYHERQRLETEKDRHLADEQGAFYDGLYSAGLHANTEKQKELLRAILDSFATEVCGNFNPKVYALATSVLPRGLSALLNALSPLKLMRAASANFKGLDDHLILRGETEALQRVAKKGTVVLVPTHSSNLDSILLGYGLYRLGLPPFLYGAGLNLFEHRILGFFMNNLGAYKVDRRKKSDPYKEILKAYAGYMIEQGYHNLFFPGGTRSRSGSVETRLKMGLLGTALQAYVRNLQSKKSKPDIFVVPCTLNYQLVLEAETLIGDHLKAVGKSRYIIDDDEFSKPRRIFEFTTKLFSMDSYINLVFGRPMDLFGNAVDDEGRSLDRRGRVVDRTRYVEVGDGPGFDDQRDREYTKELGQGIVRSYKHDTYLNATNVVSHVVFQWLREQSPEVGLYRLLRTGGPTESMPLIEAYRRVDTLVGKLRAASDSGRIKLNERITSGDAEQVVLDALTHLGSYHMRPAVERRGDRLFHIDRNLLLYYQNRMVGLDLG